MTEDRSSEDRSSDTETLNEIESLTRRLDAIQLQHAVLAEQILGVQRTINLVASRTRDLLPSPIPATVPVAVEAIEEGDRVRILNPARNRPNEGIVVGFTLTGFARIRTIDGLFVRRAVRNIRRINDVDGRHCTGG